MDREITISDDQNRIIRFLYEKAWADSKAFGNEKQCKYCQSDYSVPIFHSDLKYRRSESAEPASGIRAYHVIQVHAVRIQP